MKPGYLLQEALIFTNTSFAKKKFCSINNGNNNDHQLEEVCRSALPPGLLPGTVTMRPGNNNLFVWRVNFVAHFFYIRSFAAPLTPENYYSVNPYSFLPSENFN